MSATPAMIRALVEEILRTPFGPDREWTLQGFGMLRLYLGGRDGSVRLHVWSEAHRVDRVSDVHDHPWDFSSTIVAGALTDEVFVDVTGEMNAQLPEAWRGAQRPYCHIELKPGEGGGPETASNLRALIRVRKDVYLAGESYGHKLTDLHRSSFEDGTVTLIDRRRAPGRKDVANVYWPQDDGDWVSAEPRPATNDEVVQICGLALDRWF